MTNSVTTILAVAILFGAHAAGAQGGGPAAGADDRRLYHHVSLMLGETTVGEAIKALRAASGLPVECASYLESRSVTVLLKDVSARAALDALAQLNDWAWSRTDDGRYVIEHRRVRLPSDMAGLSTALRAALPLDVRRFMGIAVRPEDMLSPATVSAYHRVSQVEALEYHCQQKAVALRQEIQSELYDSLKPGILDGRKVPYDKLTSEQQRIVVKILGLRALEHLNLALLNGRLKMYEADPAGTKLRLKDEELDILSRSIVGNVQKTQGFGASLGPPRVLNPGN